MLVSIIVPNYNHERFLTQRLQSIFAQTFTDYEVIILDDCSTDNSRNVIEQYRNHPKVSQIVYNTSNSGSAFRQWRKGVELAKGEWVWIAESDDFCTNEILEALVKQASSHQHVVLSYCQSIEVDENGNGRRDMRWFTDQADKEHWLNDYCNSGLSEIRNYLWRLNSIPNASAVLFRKEAFQKAAREYENFKMCGDWWLWIEIVKQGNIAFCATAHNFFRKHGATTRTLETVAKRRLLAEEEYTLLQAVQNLLGKEERKGLRKKTDRILRNYSSTFGFKEVAGDLLHPRRYNKPMPYLNFMAVFFVGSLYRTAKKIRAGFAV